jgi:fructokinase
VSVGTATPLITVIGEALIDLIPGAAPGSYQARVGGSPFNVAVALSRLGNRTALMARMAEDGFGRMLRDAAAAEHIDLAGAPHAGEPTTLAVVSVDSDAGAGYDFYLQGTADWQWTDLELAQMDTDTDVLHFGSLAAAIAPGSERIVNLAADVRAAGKVLVSYDPNVRPAALGTPADARGVVARCVRCAHVVKASREDVEWLYPGGAVDEVAALWSGLGAELVVVTDGERGATAYRPGAEPVERPGRSAEIVDTIGAGDAFTAGMLSGLVRHGVHVPARLANLQEDVLAGILDEGVLVASLTCERAGADPPRNQTLTRDALV